MSKTKINNTNSNKNNSKKKHHKDIKIKIKRYLSDIKSSINYIKSILEYDTDLLENNIDKLKSLKYETIILVEAYMWLFHYILSHNHNISVDGMMDTIKEAETHGWINKKSFDTIKKLIEIRNAYLVHRYNKYNNNKKKEFIEFLRNNIPALNNLSNHIKNKLKANSKSYKV